MFSLFGKKVKPLMNLIKYTPKDVSRIIDRINDGETVNIPGSVLKDEQRHKYDNSTPLKDLNIVLFIERNTQNRIDEIDNEITEMNEHIAKLKQERVVLDAIGTTVRIHSQ